MEGHESHWHRHHGRMLSVEDALERILAHFAPLDVEEKPLLQALGQTLAEDVAADFDIPPLPNSAMDGYAVRRSDIAGATPDSPVVLNVVGQVAAGSLPDRPVGPATAVRIMTGAPIPQGADAVVPFEETDEEERKAQGRPLDSIAVRFDVGPGAHVRPAGEDVARGQMVLESGAVLRPADAGVLASLGRDTVRVVRRPRVAVLATGDELMAPGQALAPGKIYDSNSFSVAAAVQQYGGVPHLLGIAPDSLEETLRMLDRGLESDLVLTSAGVSRGDYDLVKDALRQRGEIDFWSVRMRPAKPLAFGALEAGEGRRVPHIGLPGNPVSALVAFEQFCRPAILLMLGRTELAKPTVSAVLEGPIHNNDGRRVYARVQVTRRNGRFTARPVGPQGSNLLTSVARANGLAICPEDVPQRNEGETVQVQMLHWPEEVQV